MAPSIGWNESSPDGGDSLGLGDNELRSLKTSLRIGLDGEHVWPSGGGDAGVHRLGSARPYVGTQSLVSSTGTDGRLMQTSDTSRLFGVGSGGTTLIGGPTALLVGAFPGTTAPQRHYWAIDMVNSLTGSNGSTTITIANSGYSGEPYVFVTPSRNGALGPAMISVQNKTATTFVVSSFTADGTGVAFINFDAVSIGTRVL